MPPRQSSSLSFLPSMGKSPPKTPPPVAFSTPVLSSSLLVPESMDRTLAPPSLEPPLLGAEANHRADYGESFYVDDSQAPSCNIYSSHGSIDRGDSETSEAKADSISSKEPTPKEDTPTHVSPNAPGILSLAPPAIERVMFSDPEDIDADAFEVLQDGDSSTPVVIPVRNIDFVPLFNYTAPSLQPSRSPSPPPPVDDRGQLLTKHNYHPAALPRSAIYKASSGKKKKKVTFTAPLPSQPSLSPTPRDELQEAPTSTQRAPQGWVTREVNERAKDAKPREQKHSTAFLSQKPLPRTPPKMPSPEPEGVSQGQQRRKEVEPMKKEHSLLFTSPLSKGVVLSPRQRDIVPAPTFSLSRSPESIVGRNEKEERSPVFDDEDAPTFAKISPSDCNPSPTPTGFNLEKFEQSCDIFTIQPPDLEKVDSEQLTPEVDVVIPEQPPVEEEGVQEEVQDQEEDEETLLSVARRIREKMRSPPQGSPPKTPYVSSSPKVPGSPATTPPPVRVSQESNDTEYSVLLISPDKGSGKADTGAGDQIVISDEDKGEAVEENGFAISDSNCNLAMLFERRKEKEFTRQTSELSSPPTPRETPMKVVRVDDDASSHSSSNTPVSPPPSSNKKRKLSSIATRGSGILVRLSSNSVVGKAFTPLFSTPPRLGNTDEQNVTPEKQKIQPPAPVTPPDIDILGMSGDEEPQVEQKRRRKEGSASKKRKKGERVTLSSIGADKVDFAAATKECALCKINTDDTERLVTLGELMGGKPDAAHPSMIRKCVGRRSRPIPLDLFHEVMYFHWHCLRYAQLSVDDEDTLTHALTEAISTECSGCLETGATVKCSVPSCTDYYHLPCALLIPQVKLNNKRGTLLCPDHSKKRS
eukprot:TRINITY_DN8776_c0_g1_i1.p1 TRINITY_DN8776_c0_g1~~TRINITY_DN8776_c0_g1_i1.p1  ORF type:complete len:868 (+),score=210.33 TRINITY_DN8776_c0_g1_i1:117-2720(+)